VRTLFVVVSWGGWLERDNCLKMRPGKCTYETSNRFVIEANKFAVDCGAIQDKRGNNRAHVHNCPVQLAMTNWWPLLHSQSALTLQIPKNLLINSSDAKDGFKAQKVNGHCSTGPYLQMLHLEWSFT